MGFSNSLDAPPSLSDSLLNLNPLGSFPTNWCVRSVPRSCRATAYARGFTHDCRQKGTLVSPTECLHGVRMDRGGENRLQNDKAGYKRAQSWQQLLHAEESIVPLSIHCAQRNTPQLRAELSQLRDEISHLIRP